MLDDRQFLHAVLIETKLKPDPVLYGNSCFSSVPLTSSIEVLTSCLSLQW